jgi:chaperonin GroES
VSFQVGEFKRIKVPSSRSINDSIYQLRFPEPSVVLFNLLGTMIQAAKDVTSVQDIMSGGANPSGNRETATTTMIRVEQGMKVFSAIYKRIFRALKQEFKKLYKLNGKYLDPKYYFPVLDSRELEQIGLADYQGDGTDVQPVADPQLATSALAMAKSQALLQVMQHPLINDEEVLRRYFEGHEIPAPERLFVPPDQRQQPPPPELVLKAQIAASEHTKRKSEIVANYARALRDIAKAESEEIGQQLQAYAQGLKSIIDGWGNEQEGMGGMAGVPPDQGGIQGIEGGAGADQEPGVGILGSV